MAETLTPEGVLIALVSGFGNTEKSVKEAHDKAQKDLMDRGFAVVRVDPVYPNGDLTATRDKIRTARNIANVTGKKFVSFGTSAGGTVATEERMRFAAEQQGVLLEELDEPSLQALNLLLPDDVGITAGSRTDLSHHPEIYGDKYPTAQAIKARSPLLGEVAEYVGRHKGVVLFNRENTLCLTGGSNDKVVPNESSTLPGARVVPVTVAGSNGIILNHAGIIGMALRPAYLDIVAKQALRQIA
ncbi:MAG TPA: hypothetical protein VLF93_06110 [Candidatus Saccharimonadales bacterium]|nr:hypothetical protein [Candidatus Saccharimonadales bacterium]